ncbi:MAG: pyridoxamine 5'-phosphate oxidase family protein [Bacteroidota bacterium]|nr:pyridoxamine 5'-phosphate oxidase family protein [Bacteroidota bacterium]
MRSNWINNKEEMFQVIDKCDTCYVSMVDQNKMPYVVPMNFGLQDGVIYLHSSGKGKKMDILQQNNNVCIAFSTDHQLKFQNKDVACSYAMRYRSVLIYGQVEFIEEAEAKIEKLNIIMQKYTGREFSYNAPAIREVSVWKVVIREMIGKKLGY